MNSGKNRAGRTRRFAKIKLGHTLCTPSMVNARVRIRRLGRDPRGGMHTRKPPEYEYIIHQGRGEGFF